MIIRRICFAIILLSLVPPVSILAAGGKLLPVESKSRVDESGENKVRYPCLTPRTQDIIDLGLKRKNRWSLPEQALSSAFLDTIRILVLRFDFQFESTDNPNSTGRGRMDLSDPLADPTDSATYYNLVGHLTDPPPHDSNYFDAHMRALRAYYESVSEGKLTLAWDIYPPARDSVYTLPQPMSYYGRCDFDSVVVGLENYFIDCIQLADTVSPQISFASYESIFLFHAGSDRQNDIGFPETCNDLFTGFISFGDSIAVDSGANFVRTALMMPETASQDNRGTALNAVIAHEFGHQLGLPDLYSTRSFLSQLGDFALMDNNGFGTGIDFGFQVGQIFGAIPIYPTAWSRAHLGFADVVDFRQNADLRIVAAEVLSSGIKIARIPISENEYYLIENRCVDTDGKQTALLADSATSVFLYPVDLQKNFTGEYDFLMPGSGLLVFHVDEGVAGLDYDGDGENNFDDNQLQWDADRRFITLVEGDGIVNFGGYYRAGFGKPEDMYRDDRNTSFTPNTNPPSIDNSGNNTHVRLTDISRDTMTTPQGLVFIDTVITAKLEIDGKAEGFPVRAGYPDFGLNVIADDLDRDGEPEIIVSSGQNVLAITLDGQNFLRQFTNCTTCPTFVDTAYSSVSTGVPHTLPVFATSFTNEYTSSPVTGDFGNPISDKFVAVGARRSPTTGEVIVYELADDNSDGLADFIGSYIDFGIPIALSFGSQLWTLRDNGAVGRISAPGGGTVLMALLPNDQYHGIAQIDNTLLLLAGDSIETKLYYITAPGSVDSVFLGDHYTLGPAVADLNLDGLPELITFTADGRGLLLTIDTTVNPVSYTALTEKEVSYQLTTNPIVGDVNLDGHPDVVIGGKGKLFAFDQNLSLNLNYPVTASDKFPDDDIVAAPIISDIVMGGLPEVIFPTLTGNVYSFSSNSESFGFPLSAGELGAGSAVYTSDSVNGKLGYLGADGWFYLWDVSHQVSNNFWPMGGYDPAGTYVFNQSTLPSPKAQEATLPKERFFNYPNPVTGGATTIRYFLGQDASNVSLKIFDLSGKEIAALSGATTGGIDNEISWNCAAISPGVYRCVIEADFSGQKETAFTDIAVIR